MDNRCADCRSYFSDEAGLTQLAGGVCVNRDRCHRYRELHAWLASVGPRRPVPRVPSQR